MWNFVRVQDVPSMGKRKQQSIGIKSFYWNPFFGFKYRKTEKVNCTLKRSLKEKPEQEKPTPTEGFWTLRR